MKVKYTPHSFILYGWIFCISLLIFGPYKYTIYDQYGVLYLAFSIVLFYFGSFSYIIKTKKIVKKSNTKISISKKSELIILVFEMLVLLSFIIYINFLFNITGGSLKFAAEDIRILVTNNRTMLSRFAEVGLHAAAPCYLIVQNLKHTHYKYTNLISNLFFWMPPITYLFMSARWNFFFYFLIFVINKGINKTTLNSANKLKNKKNIYFVFIYIFIIFMIITVYSLFESRGILKANNLYLIYKGDMVLKNWANTLYDYSNGYVNPIYKISNYFAHGIPTFTYFFDNYKPESFSFGLYQFQFVEYILMAIGIRFIEVNEILRTVAGYGLYKTFVLGFVIDWGFIFAPVAIFINGIFFGRIYSSRNRSLFAKCFSPIMLAMCLISPIYYFWSVGGVTFDFFFLLLLIPILKVSGAKLEDINEDLNGN